MLTKAGEERVLSALADIADGSRGQAGGETREEPRALGGEQAPGEDRTPLHPAERALIKQLLAFPEEVAEAAERRAPHRIAAHALALAQDFTAFYRDCRVVGAESQSIEDRRIALCVASRQTIARCLDLLGVGAPQEM